MPSAIHLLVLGQNLRPQPAHRLEIGADGSRFEHRQQVHLLVRMVQVGGRVEVFLHRLGRLLSCRVGAMLGQVLQQFLQRGQLFTDLVVAVFQHGDRLVEAGRGGQQGVGHGSILGSDRPIVE